VPDDRSAKNCNSGQTATSREKMTFGAARVGFIPLVEYHKVGKHSQIFIGYLYSLIGQWFRRYRIFCIGKTAENCSGQYNSWKNKIPMTRLT
jgi:hypothetical protein